ncbi:MAG: ArsR family transcriptional regulator [Candidatus Lokiarchaeota archaeon]|nr:ArsR family transcriptional regulator [Candidatus Lokiarchaeota archaeon]
MNYSKNINELLGCLKSEKRLRILKLLLDSEAGLQFSEIAEALSLVPSTLEYHLKTLVKLNLISHFDAIYSTNALTQLFCNLYKALSTLNPLIPYLNSHKLSMDDPNLFLNFITSNPIFLSDLISMLEMMKELVKSKISKFRIAGSFNLTLEERVMQFSEYDIHLDQLEIISTYEEYQKLLDYENYDYFFSFIDISNIQLFLVNECNYYMGIGESSQDVFGILFLPDATDEIDFQKALLFRGKHNVSWLNEIFEMVKRDAKRINITEDLLRDRRLFERYLKTLNNQ